VSLGKPASGVTCRLEKQEGSSWSEIGKGITNQDGRVDNLTEEALTSGIYRIEFLTGTYFEEKKVRAFYPVVSVQFEVSDPKQHYHVPLLLSPFGFSTYRGS
jgi:5-hydroxyisourate hydrolase